MKITYILFALVLVACSENSTETTIPVESETNSSVSKDSVDVKEPDFLSVVYSNERFKDVTVDKIGEHTFRIKGKGQIFEAGFGWIVEDGHYELKKGFATTDAGAPEWGSFSFEVVVEKKRENSTVHLILFETSAEDGSRKYELPIRLY
jgi:hypothetical protein